MRILFLFMFLNLECERAGVDENTKGYLNYIFFEVEAAKNKSKRNKEIWHKVEMLTIGFAVCNTVFAALINFEGTAGTIFKVLTIITSALVSAIASYNA